MAISVLAEADRGSNEYFLHPEKAASSLKDMKRPTLQAAEKHWSVQMNVMLPAPSCAVSEPLQGPTHDLFKGIRLPQLQQTPWQRSD